VVIWEQAAPQATVQLGSETFGKSGLLPSKVSFSWRDQHSQLILGSLDSQEFKA